MEWLQGLFCRCMPTVEFPQDLEDEQYEGLIQDNHPWPAGGRRLGTSAQITDGEPSRHQHVVQQEAKEEEKGELDEVKVILSIVEQMRKRPTLSKPELIIELRKMLAAFGGQTVDLEEGGSGNVKENDKEKEKEKDKEKGKGKATSKGQRGSSSSSRQPTAREQEGDLLRQVVVRNLLTWGREEIVNRERIALLPSFVEPLIGALDDVQQAELYSILRYMPASVLGDEFAREQTRVFIDVTKDVKESQRADKNKVTQKAKVVEIVSGIIIELVQALGPGEEGPVLGALLASLQQPQVLRLVLEQLLLVQDWLPSDLAKRGILFKDLFRESVTLNAK